MTRALSNGKLPSGGLQIQEQCGMLTHRHDMTSLTNLLDNNSMCWTPIVLKGRKYIIKLDALCQNHLDDNLRIKLGIN